MLLFSCPSHADQTVGYNIFLTNQENNNQPLDEPMTQFDCSDRIFLVVIVAGLKQENHELKVRWLGPAGDLRELTRYEFRALPVSKIWAWLQLHGPTGAIVGQMFDPSFGMEEFIGEWSAEVYIDGEQVSLQQFQVLC